MRGAIVSVSDRPGLSTKFRGRISQINSGGRYNPVTDTWTATSLTGAPAARLHHTSVWTGSQMIVWGGCTFVNDACSSTALGNSGGRYDPASADARGWNPRGDRQLSEGQNPARIAEKSARDGANQ